LAHSIWQNAHLEQLDEGWLKVLQPCLKTPQAEALASFLETQLELQGGVLPLQEHWFKAFKLTPFKQVKVVILGQDPYHGMEQGQPQAHGLSFSVNQGIKTPPSLRNILKELTADLAIQTSTHGDLSQWALQGVLLLNTVLTVAQSQAGAHQGKGWEAITDAVIRALSEQSSGLVFMLWGKPAQAKAALIDTNKHWILQAVHPSPLSAYRGFFGCGHFSKANVHLSEQGLSPIDWQRTPLLKEARQIQLL
jgi:uracil-DNA glycosylase|tara:strand:- start:493 stop:1242 length:750 start_codon:yes stop_codon:yes gene_type:complete